MKIRNPEINFELVNELSKIFKKLNLKPDRFTNPKYYPPENLDKELTIMYFTVMVAIDHRTGFEKSFEGYVNGEFFHGADLLWRLGRKILDENPEFFKPENLAKLRVEEFNKYFNIDGLTLWDSQIRTYLLNDLGLKIVKFYNNSILELFKRSKGYLRRNGFGIIEQLRVFRAFEDPVEKKPFLLTKFLLHRGLIEIKDIENLEVPVDNHLCRIAYRLGIVKLPEELIKYIIENVELPYEIDVKLRSTVRSAWKEISRLSGILPTVLDDFLWSFGRKVCTFSNPECSKCPFQDVCTANKLKTYIVEHRFKLTWYY